MNVKLRVTNVFGRILDSCLRIGGARFHDHVVRNLFFGVPFGSGEPANPDVGIFLPPEAEPDAADVPIVRRIFAAYRKAKKDQADVDAVFLPSSLWRRQLDISFGELIAAGETGDVDRVQRFLANFGASENYTGINYSTMIRECAKSPARARHFERMIVGQMAGWWLRSESRGRDLSALSHPRHGNQAGARIDGRFIGVDSVLND